MNHYIISNLYAFWKHVGLLNKGLIEYSDYTAVSVENSDWPNRVFDISGGITTLKSIQEQIKKGKLQQLITTEKPNNFANEEDLEYVFGQKNMAVKMEDIVIDERMSPHIVAVKSDDNAYEFAKVASGSFGYIVNPEVIKNIVHNSELTQLFLFTEENQSLGCGMLYLDSNNNAGLHMIGTLPEGRGKGIGKMMTKHLLAIAKEQGAENTVLHASLIGEPIYTKLGFQAYGEIETFRMKNK